MIGTFITSEGVAGLLMQERDVDFVRLYITVQGKERETFITLNLRERRLLLSTYIVLY
jgi:hypothetical protein